MSYDIYLRDPITREVLELDEPHHMRGCTYAVGGTTEAHLNVTYNYAPIFCRVFWDASPTGGIRSLYGKTGAESIPLLDAAIAQLGDDVHSDYWKPTEGNVKRALIRLRALAAMRPDGVWDGD